MEALAPGTSRTTCGEPAQASQMKAPNTALWELWKSLRDYHELPQGLLRGETQALDRLLNRGNPRTLIWIGPVKSPPIVQRGEG